MGRPPIIHYWGRGDIEKAHLGEPSSNAARGGPSLKGPPGPLKEPRGPLKGPRGPFKGPRGPFLKMDQL